MKNYDYIFIGAGCAGLSLLMRLMDDHLFSKKSVLIIDKDKKERNDRTWCYWEKGSGYFESIVCKTWKELVVKNRLVSQSLDVDGYLYKMVRGIDFYEHCFRRIAACSNIEYRIEEVSEVINNNGTVVITTSTATLKCKAGFVFNSIFQKPTPSKRRHYLLQHFKGWVINTATHCFNPHQALLMDFSVDQENNPAAFIYVLPLSATKALVEYTVFSDAVFSPEVYDEELKNYIQHTLKVSEYSIEHSEFGVIPMTNHRFPVYKDGIVNIGTAGGQTKASTGYTFQFIQKQAAHLAAAIRGRRIETRNRSSFRFHLYDSILLRILANKKMKGSDAFMQLFQRVPASLVFKFLDNETSFAEDLKILRAMPSQVFLPAALREINNLRFEM
ncbi:MAG: lycopene cyclase family protein [Agriterribacter sp.]